jgi:hypothetical protein
MAIDFVGGKYANLAAQSLLRLSQVSAAPNFEVRFNAAQNTALDRFDEQIARFQKSNFGQSQTALLRAKATRLEKGLEAAEAFKAYASTNRQAVRDLLDQFVELRNLADPATQAEFEAKRAQVLDTIDKLLTANTSGLGAPDGLRTLKAQALAAVGGYSAADGASATAAQTSIDSLTLSFTTKLEILELNQDGATTLVKSRTRVLGKLRAQIEDIEIKARASEIDKIKKKQEELGQLFGTLSLAFEGSKHLTKFVADNTVLTRELEPGSILNLFA